MPYSNGKPTMAMAVGQFHLRAKLYTNPAAPKQTSVHLMTKTTARQQRRINRVSVALSLLADGFRQGAARVPAFQDAAFQRARFEAEQAFPLRYGVTLPVKLQDAIVAAVVSLRQFARPSAIRRLVMSIRVNAIKGVAGRAWSHVGDEGREVLRPSLAHPNAATAVVAPCGQFLIRAARLGCGPRGIFRRARPSVRAMGCRRSFAHQAAATLCVPFQKVRPEYLERLSAFAATVQLIVAVRSVRFNSEAPELGAHILAGGHV